MRQTLEVFHHNARTFVATITANAAITINEAWFSVKVSKSSSTYLIQKTLTAGGISLQNNGTATVTATIATSHSDTETLPYVDQGYEWDLQILLDTNEPYTVAEGPFTVLATVTRETA